jgi:hypothetical protein
VALVFVVMGTQPGLEVVHPMAVVILGGLITTTLMSLFVLPALYLRFGGHQPTLSPEEELMHRWVGIEPTPAGAGAEPVGADGNVAASAAQDEVRDGGGDSGERQTTA